jgi:ABC-type branched-subunit amino acid transport system substrate-binding protein
MMQAQRLSGLATIVLAATWVSSCGGDKSAAGPGVDLKTKTVSIGLLSDESGPAAVVGRPYAWGKRILATEINAGGSGLLPEGWKVELVERDYAYNPQRAVQLFNEIRDQVLFFGHNSVYRPS